ncbi:MAG: hypothetical protein WCW27_06485 [Patescibacteria group bacterium]|jgi:hypothetical protein
MAVGHNTKYGKILAEWQVPEYIKYQHFFGWYLGAGLIGGFFFIHALINRNFLFVIIIALIALISYLHERNEPALIELLITEDGLVFGEKFYPYREFTSFWIVYEPPDVKTLYFTNNKTLRSEFPIHLENQNPITIRQLLLNYLPEDIEKEEEAIEEKLGRAFRI